MREFQAAAVTALETAWRADRVHMVGAVPKIPATPYVVISVTSPSFTNVASDGRPGGKGFRIVAQYVGADVDEVAFAADKGEAAYMNGNRLNVTGFDCSPVDPIDVVSSPVIRDPDGGGFLTCTVLYPFNAYPTA